MNYAEDRIDRKTRVKLQKDLKQLYKHNHENNHKNIAQNLRDMGQNISALFHYAFAWELQPENAICAGDYAQMAEFCGYPELGVLALLFYRSGGRPSISDDQSESLSITTNETEYENELYHADGDTSSRNDHDNNVELESSSSSLCECGMKKCGSFAGIVPFPFFNDNFEVKGQSSRIGRITKLLKNHVTGFWEDDIDDDFCATFNDSNEGSSGVQPSRRQLPPLLQLLLLKLLYSSSIGGGPLLFLEYVCNAIPHFSQKFQQSSRLNYKMLASGKKHKSHWAYYILIRAVVVGERMKPHRRQFVPYHIPVNEIVNDRDRRHKQHCDDYFVRSKDCCVNQCSMEIYKLVIGLMQAKTISQIPSLQLNWENENNKPIIMIGDSHIISIAWQTIKINVSRNKETYDYRTILPMLVTGLKAWHCRSQSLFFTSSNLHLVLTRIRNIKQRVKSIIISAGEIDCREGIGGKVLEGYNATCDSAVELTVQAYIEGLRSLSTEYQIQILVMPVAPHAYRSEKNGKSRGRSLRRKRMTQWNQLLRKYLAVDPRERHGSVYFLDFWEKLSTSTMDDTYILKKCFNADYTHMNSAFLPLLEEGINQSSCNHSLL